MQKRARLLALMLVANVILWAGILYAVSTSTTVTSPVSDAGGTPYATSSGASSHWFYVGTFNQWRLSYATTLYHNGSFAGSNYNTDTGPGPLSLTVTTAVYNTVVPSVSTAHDSSGTHYSYIRDDYNISDFQLDPHSSYDSRSSD